MSADSQAPISHDIHVVFAQYAAVEPGTGAVTVVRGWLSKFWPENGVLPVNASGYVILDFPVTRLKGKSHPLTVSICRSDEGPPGQLLVQGEFSFEKHDPGMVVGQVAFPIHFKLNDYGRYQLHVALGNSGEELTGVLELSVEERRS